MHSGSSRPSCLNSGLYSKFSIPLGLLSGLSMDFWGLGGVRVCLRDTFENFMIFGNLGRSPGLHSGYLQELWNLLVFLRGCLLVCIRVSILELLCRWTCIGVCVWLLGASEAFGFAFYTPSRFSRSLGTWFCLQICFRVFVRDTFGFTIGSAFVSELPDFQVCFRICLKDLRN